MLVFASLALYASPVFLTVGPVRFVENFQPRHVTICAMSRDSYGATASVEGLEEEK